MPGEVFEPAARVSRSISSDAESCTSDKDNESAYRMTTTKVRNSQPPDTLIYKVKANDKLTSLAAFYDTTPSILKKINKLTIDFLYPDQLLYIPITADSDSASDIYMSSTSSCEDEKITSTSNHATGLSASKKAYPGFAHRLSSLDTSSVFESSYQDTPASAGVDQSEVRRSHDQMFVKLQSNYFASCQCEISGTLLVTPNAVMFDPNVSDPLVLQNGVEEYGLIAKLDTVISAAIYRDSQAMYNLHHQKDDPTLSKPEVYHMEGCQMSTGEAQNSANTLTSADRNNTERTLSDGQNSLSCSCGADQTILNTADQDIGSTIINWEDNCWDAETNRENSKVTFDVDEEAKSSPVNFKGMGITADNKNLDDVGIDFDLGEEKVSQSVEAKITSFQKKTGHRRTASSASSLFSIGVSSNTDVYVDYSCGMFINNGSVSSANKELMGNKTRPHNTAGVSAEDQCDSAQSATCLTVHLEGGVSKEERPDLFQPISDLMSDCSKLKDPASPPFYLCLQVGQPINERYISDTCPIEAYRKQPKPEYWFTVPGDKVDALYSFFVQWRPGLYGEEITDESALNSRGFVAIPNRVLEHDGLSKLAGSPMVRQISHVQVFKDWEILSMDEAVRRTSLLDLEKYLPIPDLRGESLLLSEDDIKKLAACLPARVEGHRWRLAYSNEDHGFSLQTFYRNMCEFDSATILVVQDENDGLFGAFSSSPFHLCEHFYGNGECFLFTYVDGFKSFRWSSKNMFCVRGGTQGLTIGTGGANCGLWLDADMYHGRTQHCDTFDNEPLTGGAEDFIVKGIEVWSLNDEDYD